MILFNLLFELDILCIYTTISQNQFNLNSQIKDSMYYENKIGLLNMNKVLQRSPFRVRFTKRKFLDWASNPWKYREWDWKYRICVQDLNFREDEIESKYTRKLKYLNFKELAPKNISLLKKEVRIDILSYLLLNCLFKIEVTHF